MVTTVLIVIGFSAARAFAESPNATEAEPAWMPEPKGRGTWGLLFSCLFTLILCIWTAIHDDVIQNGTTRQRLGSRIAWMLLALIKPEVVIEYAAYQWKMARDVHKFWCNHVGVEPNSDNDRLGMEGAFFVVMGGFTLGPCDHLGRYPAAVSILDFKRLTTNGRISATAVNKRLIIDKGRADTVGKLLALVQAFSIVVQCIIRKAQGLPVTLLELHVVVQVLFTGILYGFWWYKPLNVIEPIPLLDSPGARYPFPVVYGQDSPILVAIMDSTVTPDGVACPNTVAPATQLSIAADSWFITTNPLSTTNATLIGDRFGVVLIMPDISGVSIGQITLPPDDSIWSVQEIAHRRRKDHVLLLPGEFLVQKDNVFTKYFGTGDDRYISLTRCDVETLCQKASEIRSEEGTRALWTADPDKRLLSTAKHCLLAPTRPVWEEIKNRESLHVWRRFWERLPHADEAKRIYSLMLLFSGAAHSTAWQGFFLSGYEQQVWRISCVYRMALGVLTYLDGQFGIIDPTSGKTRDCLIAISLGCMMMVFPLSFLFIIESFISLRRLPGGAYKTVVWEDIWPHI